ncbi:MAG: hypothetical protein KAS32_29850 [Candidatus Peribacteraceae bacterium]|nr:hypothetical protein [Candidatus Peribacteraceae bacterium]
MKRGRPKVRDYDKSVTIRMSNRVFDHLKREHETISLTWNEFLRLRLTMADFMSMNVVLAAVKDKTVCVRMSKKDAQVLRLKFSQFCHTYGIWDKNQKKHSFNGFLVGLLERGK